jgi:hypothetical protein
MVSTLFSALFAGFKLLDMQMQPDAITITAQSTALSAACPRCGQASARVHSYYTRSPQRPIDLLPERNAATLETWLQEHPGVEVIARDRGPEYMRGATAGAPQVIQVADRFHLLTNLRKALERVLGRTHASLRTRLATTLPSTEAGYQSMQCRCVRDGAQVWKPPCVGDARAEVLVQALDRLKKERELSQVDELAIDAFKMLQSNTAGACIVCPKRASLSKEQKKDGSLQQPAPQSGALPEHNRRLAAWSGTT